MLATVMNALVLEAAIERAGVSARTMSALSMPQVCETYERQRALRHLEDNRVLVFAGGTGNPYFTTDTTAVLRAAEMGCEAVLKATDVDGVYTADPKRDPSATRYQQLDHQEALDRRLRIMDATAFALAQENRMPIIVFSILEQGSIANVLRGKGTLPSSVDDAVVGSRPPGPTQSGWLGRSRAIEHYSRRTPWQLIDSISTISSAACRARLPRSRRSFQACAPDAPRPDLLDHVQVEAYGSICRSISWPPSAYRSRVCLRSGLGSIDGPRGREGDLGRQSWLDAVDRGTGA